MGQHPSQRLVVAYNLKFMKNYFEDPEYAVESGHEEDPQSLTLYTGSLPCRPTPQAHDDTNESVWSMLAVMDSVRFIGF